MPSSALLTNERIVTLLGIPRAWTKHELFDWLRSVSASLRSEGLPAFDASAADGCRSDARDTWHVVFRSHAEAAALHRLAQPSIGKLAVPSAFGGGGGRRRADGHVPALVRAHFQAEDPQRYFAIRIPHDSLRRVAVPANVLRKVRPDHEREIPASFEPPPLQIPPDPEFAPPPYATLRELKVILDELYARYDSLSDAERAFYDSRIGDVVMAADLDVGAPGAGDAGAVDDGKRGADDDDVLALLDSALQQHPPPAPVPPPPPPPPPASAEPENDMKKRIEAKRAQLAAAAAATAAAIATAVDVAPSTSTDAGSPVTPVAPLSLKERLALKKAELNAGNIASAPPPPPPSPATVVVASVSDGTVVAGATARCAELVPLARFCGLPVPPSFDARSSCLSIVVPRLIADKVVIPLAKVGSMN